MVNHLLFLHKLGSEYDFHTSARDMAFLFLQDCYMVVEVGGVRPSPRFLFSGVPQGCIQHVPFVTHCWTMIWIRFLDGRLRMGCPLTLTNLRLFWSLFLMWAWWCLTCFWARRRSHGLMLWLIWGLSMMVSLLSVVRLRRFVPKSMLRCIDCVCWSSWLKSEWGWSSTSSLFFLLWFCFFSTFFCGYQTSAGCV
jgi:hypothetical protein